MAMAFRPVTPMTRLASSTTACASCAAPDACDTTIARTTAASRARIPAVATISRFTIWRRVAGFRPGLRGGKRSLARYVAENIYRRRIGLSEFGRDGPGYRDGPAEAGRHDGGPV